MENLLAEYLTELDLAKELGINIRTLREWKRLGTAPPYVPIGRKILYRRTTVQEWIASREVRRRRRGR